MNTRTTFRLLAVVLSATWLMAQSKGTSVLGTITALRVESAEFEIKLDTGNTASAQLSGDTVFQRVAPGQKDLSTAEKIEATGVAMGDRVLVTFLPDSKIARRVIVMSASSIAKRNDADKQDWTKRGLSGVVAEKKGNEITLKLRSLMGETQSKVIVTDDTSFRRYATGSVKFSDAKPSSAAEIKIGDQLRARGQKSEDGAQVTAEEVVFGSFVTKAGEVVSVDAAQSVITVKETGTGKALLVKIQPDSQIKRMPSFPGGPVGSGLPGGAGPGAGGFGPGGAIAGSGMGGPGMAGRPGGAPGGPGGGPGRDLSQMFERLPAIRFEDLKPGETIVVSSTLSAKPEQLTAIMMVANAEFLVRMATMQQAQQGQAAGRRGGMGIGGPSIGGGLLEFPTMMP